jgi:uncharacterized membrane protein YgcG
VKVLRTLALVLLLSFSAIADEIPARPEFGVLDGARILPLQVLKTAERLIAEHERATFERISILTLAKSPSGELADFSRRVAEEWRKTAPRPPNSVLIVVDDDRGELEIRTGLGLDPVLPAAKVSEIRKIDFKPEWATGKKSRALVLTFVEVLRGIGSPLLDEDKATAAFEAAGFTGGWTPAPPPSRSWTPWVFLVFGLAATAFVLVRILIGEVHYTAAGWFPVPASRNLRRLFRRAKKIGSLVTGGGVAGKY